MEVLEVLAEMEEKADERWSVMEEKRMRVEAELDENRRTEERKHELQMQQMMLSCLQTLSNFSHHPNYMPTPPIHPLTPASPTPLHSSTQSTQHQNPNTFRPTVHYSETQPPDFYTYPHNSSN